MIKTVRVGRMPGRIEEYAVEVGSSIGEVLELAGLETAGYEVKIDGATINDINSTITENTNLILLAKMVKGNADKIVRVGMMPGRIEEFAVTVGSSIAEVLALANLNPSGFDVKVDGNNVTDVNNTLIDENTNLILLAKQVKGN